MEGSIAFPRPCPRQRGDPLLVRSLGTGWGRGGPAGCPGHPLPTWGGVFCLQGDGGGCIFIHSLIHSSTKSLQFLLHALQRLGTKDPSLPPTKLVGQQG